MKKFILTLATLASLTLVSNSQVLLAYWNFDDAEFTVDGQTIIRPVLDDLGTNSSPAAPAAAVGTQVSSLNIVASGGWTLRQTGSTVFEIGGPYQQALSVQGNANNGTFFTVQTINMTGLQDLTLEFAYRSTSTGMTASQWAWSLDDITYTNFGPTLFSSVPGNFEPFTITAPAALNNQSTVYLRMTWDGATTAAGTGRIDNLALRATVIPEPGTCAALFALGFVFIIARRFNFKKS